VTRRRLLASAIAILAVPSIQAHGASSSDYAIVASGVADAPVLDRRLAKRIFSRQVTTWPDGTPITVVLPPVDSATMAWLCDQVLGVEPAVFVRYVSERAYRSKLERPLSAPDERAIAALVADRPGTVSVIPVDTMLPGLATLAIQ